MLKGFVNSSYIRLLIVALVLALTFVIAAISHRNANGQKKSACGIYRNDKTVRVGSTEIKAEIANNPAQLQQGLSGRPCIEQGQGMLFVFAKPGQYAFWMKDMKFPIDIVWISMEKKAVAIERNVQPNTYPDSKFINDNHHLAQYVIELKANRSNELHMTLGTPVNF